MLVCQQSRSQEGENGRGLFSGSIHSFIDCFAISQFGSPSLTSVGVPSTEVLCLPVSGHVYEEEQNFRGREGEEL